LLDFPATHRNREVIGDVLGRVFPTDRKVRLLEVASGSGQHSVYLADRFEKWVIQPTDLEPEPVRSIAAYREYHGVENLEDPKLLDVTQTTWPVGTGYEGLLVINLIHISPWECTLSLFRNAPGVLKPSGKIYLYGAYKRDGEHISESNVAFDRSLRESNSDWGVRCLNDVTEVAEENGFQLSEVVEMPANNLSVIFARSPEPSP